MLSAEAAAKVASAKVASAEMVAVEVVACAGGRSESPALPDEGVNELRLVGRMSGAPESRRLR